MKLFALTKIVLSYDKENMKEIFAAPETEFEIEDVQECERLIAIGAACNPEQRIVVAQEPMVMADAHVAVVAERDELKLLVEEARAANDEFNAKHAELTASLAAAHEEIDRLTKALTKALAKAEKR